MQISLLDIASKTGVKREEDLKVREKTLQNLRIKGAFTAQELYDGHRGKTACLCTVEIACRRENVTLWYRYLR